MLHTSHPALSTIVAILEGCKRTNNLCPILILTSLYDTSGIQRGMTTPFMLYCMRRVGAKMYFFNSSTMHRLVEPLFSIFGE